MKKLIFATRPSALARWQTQWVMTALQAAYPVAHCAVHSLKDLPVESVGNLVVGCIPPRTEVRDALISKHGYSLQTLPPASVIGTSSLRRAAQVLAARPDVTIASLRGNVDTRLRKAFEGQYDAILLAGAGLLRLGLEAHVTQWLPLEVMLPAPGQGALAVQCCANDEETLSLLSALDHAPTRAAVTAERQFLLQLGGGCAVPVAAFAEQITREQKVEISLTGLVSSPDGKAVIRVNGQGADPLQLGLQLAQQALAEGADELLASVTSHTLSTVLC